MCGIGIVGGDSWHHREPHRVGQRDDSRKGWQRVGVEVSELEEQALTGCATLQESTAGERAWGRNVKGGTDSGDEAG